MFQHLQQWLQVKGCRSRRLIFNQCKNHHTRCPTHHHSAKCLRLSQMCWITSESLICPLDDDYAWVRWYMCEMMTLRQEDGNNCQVKTQRIMRLAWVLSDVGELWTTFESQIGKKNQSTNIIPCRLESLVRQINKLRILPLEQATGDNDDNKKASHYCTWFILQHFGEAKDGDLFAIDANEKQSLTTVHMLI